jgi:hypothetical protein
LNIIRLPNKLGFIQDVGVCYLHVFGMDITEHESVADALAFFNALELDK